VEFPLEFVIDPDIHKAQTLPSSCYTNTEVYHTIKSGFSRKWHFAAHSRQLDSFSSMPLSHMNKLIEQPMLLTSEKKLRCISNVCTHRGMIVTGEPCNKGNLRCQYHGRTFDLGGNILNMPEFEGVEGFPDASDNLEEFPLFDWKGLIFTGLQPSGIDGLIEEMERFVGWVPIEEFDYDPSRFREYEIDANWILYVDNYLEGFHIPFVHRGLHATLDYDGYRTDLFDGGVLQVGIAREGEQSFDLPQSSPDYGQRIAAYYFWLYPGLMLNFYPWGLSVNVIVPLGVDRTRIIYHGFIGDQEMLGKGAGGELDKVEEEDQFIVESTQIGVRASSYDRGRYSPTKETGVHHFHRMISSGLITE